MENKTLMAEAYAEAANLLAEAASEMRAATEAARDGNTNGAAGGAMIAEVDIKRATALIEAIATLRQKR